jgi:hypothetical protein
MTRRIRDVAITTAVFLVILGMLMSINPRVRERVDQLTDGGSQLDWSGPGHAISSTAGTMLALTTSYAADNQYLFAFMVAALVLFVLMVRT